MTAIPLTGLILAGGQSRRMGQDKALLTYHDTTFLERCLTVLYESGCIDIKVSSNNLPSAIPDNFEAIGPVAGVQAFLQNITASKFEGLVVILPVDMIKMTSASLCHLIDNIADYDLVRFDNYPLPIVMRVNTSIAMKVTTMAEKAVADGGMSIKSMSQSLNSITIPVINQSELVNINTPSDLEQISLV